MIPPRRPALRQLVYTLTTLAVLAAADSGVWFVATARLADSFAAWQVPRRAAGWTMSAGPPRWAGWPLAAALVLPELSLTGGASDLPGGLSWRAAEGELSVSLLRPRQLVLRLAGVQHLRLSTLREFAFTAESFELAVPFDSPPLGPSSPDPAGPARLADITAAGLRVDSRGGALRIAGLTLHADSFSAAAQGEAALEVTGSAETIDLPPLRGGVSWPPGSHIALVALDAALTGPLPPPGDLVARAVAWRDGGGQLDLRRLALDWGSLRLSTNATLALDEQLQPTADATARMSGYDATLDALGGSGTLATSAVQAVKGVLTILARPAPEGGGPQVELPVTVQERTLSVGPFPLLRLPVWVWPERVPGKN